VSFCTDFSLTISAHRGGGYTIGDMRRSVAEGARAMDIDVWRSIDGILFVGHLKTLANYIHSSMPDATITDPSLMTAAQIDALELPSAPTPATTTDALDRDGTVTAPSEPQSLPRLSAVLAYVASEPAIETVTIEIKLSMGKASQTQTVSSSKAIASMLTDIGSLAEAAGLTSSSINRIVIIDSGLTPNDIATLRRRWPTIGLAVVWRSDVHGTGVGDWLVRLGQADMAMPSIDTFPSALAKITKAHFSKPRQGVAVAVTPATGQPPRRYITAWMVNHHDALMKALHLGARTIITDDVAAMNVERDSIRSQCTEWLQSISS
jgi:hypothetical protein